MARRKRSSLFPKKGKFAAGTRGRKVLIWTGSILGGLFLLTILGFFQLLNWLQGDSFRAIMAEKMTLKTRSDVTIPENLRIDGPRITLPQIGVTHTGIVKKATAKSITAEVERGELLERCLHITKLVVEDLHLTLDTLKETDKKYPDAQSDSFFSRFTPDTTILDSVECTNAGADLTVRRSNGKHGTYSLKGCTFSASPATKNNNSWQISVKNGRVSTPHSYLPDGNIKSASLQYADKRISLTDCHIVLTQGNLDVNGFYQTDDKSWSASFGVGNADIGRLLNDRWKERLQSEISGAIKLEGKSRKLRKASGHIVLHKGQLKALRFIPGPIDIPGQELLTDYIEDNFTTVELKEATCQILYPYSDTSRNIKNAWLFGNINIRTKNDVIRIHGRVIIEQSGTLHGVITIGISEEVSRDILERTTGPLASVINNCIPKLFNAKGEPGYHWVNINLSGSSDDPQQDFSVRLEEIVRASGAEALVDETIKTARKGLNIIPGLGSDDESGNKQEGDEEETPTSPKADGEKPEQDDKGDKAPSLIDTATDTATDAINSGLDAIPFF